MDYYSIVFKLALKILLFTLITTNKFIYANTSTVEIQIAKPVENGISYNAFSELPFSQNGITFNNDILSNPVLDNTAAKLIIAEITSDKHANLQGTIGIKGTIADLIIANPNGISWKNGKTDNVKSLSLIASKLEIPAKKNVTTVKEAKMNIAKLNLFADKIIINNNITLLQLAQYPIALAELTLNLTRKLLSKGKILFWKVILINVAIVIHAKIIVSN